MVIGFVFAITAGVLGLASGLSPRQAPPHRLAADLVPGRPVGSDINLGNVFEPHLGAKFEHRPHSCLSVVFDRLILNACPGDKISATLVREVPQLERLADLLPQPLPPLSGSLANNPRKPLNRQARAELGLNASERSIDAIAALISSLK